MNANVGDHPEGPNPVTTVQEVQHSSSFDKTSPVIGGPNTQTDNPQSVSLGENIELSAQSASDIHSPPPSHPNGSLPSAPQTLDQTTKDPAAPSQISTPASTLMTNPMTSGIDDSSNSPTAPAEAMAADQNSSIPNASADQANQGKGESLASVESAANVPVQGDSSIAENPTLSATATPNQNNSKLNADPSASFPDQSSQIQPTDGQKLAPEIQTSPQAIKNPQLAETSHSQVAADANAPKLGPNSNHVPPSIIGSGDTLPARHPMTDLSDLPRVSRRPLEPDANSPSDKKEDSIPDTAKEDFTSDVNANRNHTAGSNDKPLDSGQEQKDDIQDKTEQSSDAVLPPAKLTSTVPNLSQPGSSVVKAEVQEANSNALNDAQQPSSDSGETEATKPEQSLPKPEPEEMSNASEQQKDQQLQQTNQLQQTEDPKSNSPPDDQRTKEDNADRMEDSEDGKPFGASSETRSVPKHLPKVAKNRPENARVFIGNLASEYTTPSDIVKVFHKYGTLIEEPVLRRSFGFVQYSTSDAAKAAVLGEQGRIIGGIPIDLSIADNREVRKGAHIVNNTPFQHPKPGFNRHGRTRDRDMAGGFGAGGGPPRKRRRSISPVGSRKGGVHPPQFRRHRPEPRNGVFMRILCMSPTAKVYARHCETMFKQMTGSKADVLFIVAANLGDALGRAMRDQIPYVMVVASKDVEDGTCTIRTLEKTGYEKSGRGNGVIPLREAIEVCLIERGTIMPPQMNQGLHPPQQQQQQQQQFVGGLGVGGVGLNPGVGRPVGPGAGYARGGMIGTAQWLVQGGAGEGGGMDSGKPGWMSGGPRAPHPSNMRMHGNAGVNASMGMGAGASGMGGMGNNGLSGGGNNTGGFGYGAGGAGSGMDPSARGGGNGGYGQVGMGLGGNNAGPAGLNQMQGLMGGPARNDMYNTTGGLSVGGGFGGPGGVTSGQDYGRSNAQMGYGGMGGYGQGGGFNNSDPRLPNQGLGGRMSGSGNRDNEYDPAMVGHGGRGGDYSDWGRDQERDLYGGGNVGGNGRDGGGNNNGAQGFRSGNTNGGYGLGRSGNEVGQGLYGGPNSSGASGRDMGSGQGYDGGMYSGNNGQSGGGGYGGMYGGTGSGSGGMGYRTGNDGQMGLGGNRGRHNAGGGQQGYDDGSHYGGGRQGGGGTDAVQRGNPDGHGNSVGGSGPTGGNNNNGGDSRRGGAAGSATMDLGKISNLISAFQQQKQQPGPQIPAGAAGGGQPGGRGVGGGGAGAGGAPGSGAGAAGGNPRLMAGNMSQILADPAVQQAIQNIGGTGRLGLAVGASGGMPNGQPPMNMGSLGMGMGGLGNMWGGPPPQGGPGQGAQGQPQGQGQQQPPIGGRRDTQMGPTSRPQPYY